MKSSIRDFLPRQLALNDVKTTETFTLKEIQLKGGETDYQHEYELHKAPIKTVKNVTAKVDGDKRELEKGIDYTVNQKSTVEILESGTTPDIGSDFDVTYVSESILSRYIDSIEEGTDKISDEIGIDEEDETVSGITASKYISTASEEELEEIGKLFGELGRRGGRDEERYRQYLKSIAKVYTGSGRKKNVAEASSVVVSDEDNDIDIDSIEFEEYFDEQEFSVRFNKFQDHRVSLIYDVIDLADPSGVKLRSPIYVTPETYTGYSEGPNPDLDKYADIDSLDAFSDDFISPFNHESPTRGEYPSNVFVRDGRDILDSGLLTNVRKPIEFQWAKKIENEQKEDDDPSWSQFQWAEDDWAGTVDKDVYFTGVKWEQADWNKFPYTDFGVVGADTVGFSEVVDGIVADRTIDSTTVSDPAQVTPNIKLKVPQTGFIWDKSNWSDNLWDSGLVEITAVTENKIESDIQHKTGDTQGLSDNSTDEIQQSPFDEFVVSNDTKTLDIEDIVTEDTILNEEPVSSDIEQTTTEESISNDIESKSVQQAGIIWGKTDWNESSWDRRTEHINVSDPLLFDIDFTSPIATESVSTDPISTPIPNINFPFSEDITLQEDPVFLELDDSIPEDILSTDSNTLEVENTNTEDTTSNELLSVDVTEIGWGANWNTLQWPRA